MRGFGPNLLTWPLVPGLDSLTVVPLPLQVKRELAAVLLFEPHSKAGTVCKSCLGEWAEATGEKRWVPGACLIRAASLSVQPGG